MVIVPETLCSVSKKVRTTMQCATLPKGVSPPISIVASPATLPRAPEAVNVPDTFGKLSGVKVARMCTAFGAAFSELARDCETLWLGADESELISFLHPVKKTNDAAAKRADNLRLRVCI